MEYIEKDCVVTHQGRAFEAGGAAVTSDRIVAYLGKDGALQTWHGETLGTYRFTASWATPRSYVSRRMYQVEATVDGATYTGRSAGVGMVYFGKPKAGQR